MSNIIQVPPRERRRRLRRHDEEGNNDESGDDGNDTTVAASLPIPSTGRSTSTFKRRPWATTLPVLPVVIVILLLTSTCGGVAAFAPGSSSTRLSISTSSSSSPIQGQGLGHREPHGGLLQPRPFFKTTTRSASVEEGIHQERSAQKDNGPKVPAVGGTATNDVNGRSSTIPVPAAREPNNNNHNDDEKSSSTPFQQFYRLPKTAYRIYTSYVRQLWRDTNTNARTRIANDKVRASVRDLQHLLRQSDEYNYDNFDHRNSNNGEDEDSLIQAQRQLLRACDVMLAALPQEEEEENGDETLSENGKSLDLDATTMTRVSISDANSIASVTDQAAMETANGTPMTSNNESTQVALIPVAAATTTNKNDDDDDTTAVAPKKKQRSILFGAVMGAVVAAWVFSGNYIFTGVFCLMTILGQLEYYRMVMSTGVFPARRISVVGATSMFVTALFAPELHQICLPMFGLWAMIWKLTMRRQIATIPEIATTFTGMFYLGYVPSFWVRTRLLGEVMEPTRLFPFTSAMRTFLHERLGDLVPSSFVHVPITRGAVFIFWSWLSLAFSDVGAYFVGRKYGKTKLGAISPAAGVTSPNKSVEGVVGGCLTSAMFSIAGAWVQKWPYWFVTGAIHGMLLGLLGLIGDLTASMLKRDAGLKDFGNLIPEHGGIIDRVDSFVWTAPYSWVVCAYIIPALKAACGQ